jgi:carbamate kinase
MDEERAKARQENEGWSVVEDAGRGWRRVVPSPKPKEIVEADVIQELIKAGIIVIGVGGGGIPVVEDDQGTIKGVEAVIDKDFGSALLATLIDADLFIISTAVEKVALNFNKPDQKWVDQMTVAEAKSYIEEGHFAPGSMLPKIQAIIQFLEKGGKKALITDPAHIVDALEGKTGTWIIP